MANMKIVVFSVVARHENLIACLESKEWLANRTKEGITINQV